MLQAVMLLTEEIKKQTFKNNAPFRSCISKLIISTLVDNAEDLDILMHNLLEYSDNYSMTPKRLWN